METWDVYDIFKCKIKDRVVTSVDELNKGEYNLVTASWVCNSRGEFLMQKRAANKTYPLVFANHGGRAKSGESSKESMIRELQEEIGLSVKEDELIFLRTFNDDKSIFDEYIVFKDINMEDIVIDLTEVESCRWVTIDELSNLIDEKLCFDYKNNHPKGMDSFSLLVGLLKK